MKPDPGSPELVAFIRGEINRLGRVTFRWFMEQALYHPRHGYYSSGKSVVGRKGDFLTNVSAGALYGSLMARQFAGVWDLLGRPPDFTIVEQGAHDGLFARDVLMALRGMDQDLNGRLGYIIVEPFEILEERQRQLLETAGCSRVQWRKNLSNLDPFEGVHFSNELIDSFPVHRVTRRETGWIEKYVGLADDRFVFEEGPVSETRLQDRLARLGACFPNGYETEINLDAEDWIWSISGKLQRGCILAVDYGYPRDVYYQPRRLNGTLSCYSRHRRSDDPLAAVGERDITAHVDFTSLAEAAIAAGLNLAGFTDQHHFLLGQAVHELSGSGDDAHSSPVNLAPDTSAAAESPPSNQRRRPGIPGLLADCGEPPDAALMRQFKMLMHPELMGTQFKAIAFSRGIGNPPPLPGFQFARDARRILWPDP